MGIKSAIKERLNRRKHQVDYDSPPRTIVLAHDLRAIEHWCRAHGISLRDPRLIAVTTGSFRPERIQGYRFRPHDMFVVLETAAFGHGWSECRREILMRTGGWVDIEERKEHFI